VGPGQRPDAPTGIAVVRAQPERDRSADREQEPVGDERPQELHDVVLPLRAAIDRDDQLPGPGQRVGAVGGVDRVGELHQIGRRQPRVDAGALVGPDRGLAEGGHQLARGAVPAGQRELLEQERAHRADHRAVADQLIGAQRVAPLEPIERLEGAPGGVADRARIDPRRAHHGRLDHRAGGRHRRRDRLSRHLGRQAGERVEHRLLAGRRHPPAAVAQVAAHQEPDDQADDGGDADDDRRDHAPVAAVQRHRGRRAQERVGIVDGVDRADDAQRHLVGDDPRTVPADGVRDLHRRQAHVAQLPGLELDLVDALAGAVAAPLVDRAALELVEGRRQIEAGRDRHRDVLVEQHLDEQRELVAQAHLGRRRRRRHLGLADAEQRRTIDHDARRTGVATGGTSVGDPGIGRRRRLGGDHPRHQHQREQRAAPRTITPRAVIRAPSDGPAP
jgi:hypothetical protein